MQTKRNHVYRTVTNGVSDDCYGWRLLELLLVPKYLVFEESFIWDACLVDRIYTGREVGADGACHVHLPFLCGFLDKDLDLIPGFLSGKYLYLG